MKKSKQLNKTTSWVLAVALLVCMLPMSAAAAEAEPASTSVLPVETAGELPLNTALYPNEAPPPVIPPGFNTTIDSAVINEDSLTVEASISGDDLSGTQAMVAAYDSAGRMLGLEFMDIDGSLTSQSPSATIPGAGQATQTKVFLLDSTSFAPLTVAAVSLPTSAISSIDLVQEKLTLLPGQTEQLAANVWPETATTAGLHWSSNNKNVVTVDETGLMTAVGVGEATITVTAPVVAYSDSCQVSVAYGAITGEVVLRHGVAAELSAIAAFPPSGGYSLGIRLSTSTDFTGQIDAWCADQSQENGVYTFLGAAILEENTTYYYRAYAKYYDQASDQWKELLGEIKSFETGASNAIPDLADLTFSEEGTASLSLELSAGMHFYRITSEKHQQYDIELNYADPAQSVGPVSIDVSGPSSLPGTLNNSYYDNGGLRVSCILLGGLPAYLSIYVPQDAYYDLTVTREDLLTLTTTTASAIEVSWVQGEDQCFVFTPEKDGWYQLRGADESNDLNSWFSLYSPTGEKVADDVWRVEEQDPEQNDILELYAELTAWETYLLCVSPYTESGPCSLWVEPVEYVEPGVSLKSVETNGPLANFELEVSAPLGSNVRYGIRYSADRGEVEDGGGNRISAGDSQTDRPSWSWQWTELIESGKYYCRAFLEMYGEGIDDEIVQPIYYSDIHEFTTVEAPALELSEEAATLLLSAGHTVYLYTPEATAEYTLTFSGAGNADKELWLYDAYGDELQNNWDGADSVSLTPVVLFADQKYYIVCQVDTAADYELSLSSVALTVLSGDEDLPTTVSWTNGEDTYYAFTPLEGGAYQLQGVDESSDFDSYFHLYSPTGEELGYDEWWVDQDDPLELSADLTAGETYVLRISPYTESGSCSLYLTLDSDSMGAFEGLRTVHHLLSVSKQTQAASSNTRERSPPPS